MDRNSFRSLGSILAMSESRLEEVVVGELITGLGCGGGSCDCEACL